MDRYLVISVTFLHGRYHGSRGQGERDPWPPSPLRLFQALVAGARSGCRASLWTDAKIEAFRWLERLDPPGIVAPPAEKRGISPCSFQQRHGQAGGGVGAG